VNGRAAAALVLALAALGVGCEESASPEPAAPRLVSVLGTGSERATAFAVAPGRLVTVAHGVSSEPSVRVQAGRRRFYRARVLARDERTDLAVLAVPGPGGPVLETATTGNEEEVRVMVLRGDRVASAGSTVRRAIRAHVRAPGAARPLTRPALELQARVRAGDSGAPVLTESGELAGVVFARSRNDPNTAYAVAAEAVERLLGTASR
jgi:S1-C subfamily serine protease